MSIARSGLNRNAATEFAGASALARARTDGSNEVDLGRRSIATHAPVTVHHPQESEGPIQRSEKVLVVRATTPCARSTSTVSVHEAMPLGRVIVQRCVRLRGTRAHVPVT